jgi:hypothetical protein
VGLGVFGDRHTEGASPVYFPLSPFYFVLLPSIPFLLEHKAYPIQAIGLARGYTILSQYLQETVGILRTICF